MKRTNILCFRIVIHALIELKPDYDQLFIRQNDENFCLRTKGNGAKCQSLTAQGVDDGLRQVILQAHNSLRSLIASGQETGGRPGPQPPASNMQFMV